MDFTKQAKKKGAKTAIVTDNMDIFQQIFVPHNRLDNFFDKITSSHKYKQLKVDNNGQLFDITRDHLSIDYQNTIMLDDSSKLANLMTLKGIHFYLYNNQTKNNFINWFDQRYFFG